MTSFVRRVLAVLILALAIPAFGQAKAEVPAWPPQTLDAMRQIQKAALASDYAWQQMAHLTDNIGPRMAGSPQAQAAVQYVADQMRGLGLEVKLEPVQVPRWVRGEERAELVAYPGQVPGTTQKIVVTALGAFRGFARADGITADVVVVNSFDDLKAMGREKVAGKVVLFNRQFDRGMAEAGLAGDAYGEAVEYRERGPVEAARLGAVAALVRSVGGAEFRLAHTGVTAYRPDVPAIPAGAVSAEDAGLMARLSAQGPVRMHLVLTPSMLPDVTAYNVIADLKGSEQPEQIVIVSGHIDSWDLGTGAIDDAGGVAEAMATVQLLKQLKLQPKRTIRMIAWMGEETGIWGGRQYRKDHENDVARHFAAVESDLGVGHPMGFFLQGGEGISELFAPVSGVLQGQGAGLMQASDHTGADTIPLNIMGVPAIHPILDTRQYFDYHHTAADTLDKVNPSNLRENVAALAVMTYALATMDKPLPRKVQPVPEWMK